MKKTIPILALILFAGTMYVEANETIIGQPKIVWDRTYDTGKLEYARSILRSSDGGYLVTGCFGRPAGSTHVAEGMYLLKVDSEGKKIWDKKYVVNDTDRGHGHDAVQSGDGGYVVTGSTRSFYTGNVDLHLLKVDGEGEKVWEKNYGGSRSKSGKAIVQSGDGGFVIAGKITEIAGTKSDVYVLKVDAKGEKVWERTFGRKGREEASSIVQSGDEGFVLAGLKQKDDVMSGDLYVLKVDEDGEKVWERSFGGWYAARGWCIVQSGDGGFVVAGETDVFLSEKNYSTYHVYLLKIDRDGNNVWEKIHTTPQKAFSSSSAYRIIQDGDGGFVVTGRSGLALLVLRIDSHGEIVWEKVYEEGNGAELSTWFDLVRSCDGGFVLAGGSKPTGYTYPLDVYLFKITESEEAEFHYVSQSFQCDLYDKGSEILRPAILCVAHAAVLKCTQGYLDTVNLTIPYGKEEIHEPGFKVLNTAGESLGREIHQTGNETTVSIRLPRTLGPDDDFVVILNYWVYDLPGDQGIYRPVKTSFLDSVLGGGERSQVTYRPGVFDEPPDEIIVRILLPLGYVPKTYEPARDGCLSGDPVTSKVSLVWHLTTDIPKAPEFRVVFGKPSLMQSRPGLVMLGIMALFVVCGLILILRKVKYLSSKGVQNRMEK